MKKFMATVYVFRKTECRNPEEPTTLDALNGQLNLKDIKGIRMGKCFLLTVEAETEEQARATVETASKKLLTNLVMERYEIIKVEETKEAATV